MAVGVLNLLLGLLAFLGGVFVLASTGSYLGLFCLGVGIADGIASFVILFAGLRMLALRSYALAVTGSFLALFPFVSLSGCFLLGAGVGIWALVVLLDEEVKSEFPAPVKPV
jgi:hypothetical protein